VSVEADPLQARGADVAMLSNALRRGGSALESVPEQIKQILRGEEWRHFVTRLGKEVRHERFADFVATPPLAGLGADVPLVRRLIANDPEALDLLDRALQNPASAHAGNNVPGRPEGNSRDKALRKLRKDAPELHAEVLAGRLSAHAAMVKAGYRKRTFTVRPDPSSAVRSLRKYMTPDQLAELARLLTEET
jgi:hypothetical protein